ncbi:Fumagillin beta-trans-bergamotene synthase [Colletotrichum orbiculare MAFF 240422]|uniref:Fumagillin beta-trans-bergamotene synthase n=1 Tax=Colletotrichum orbiculare (strain 104-T / ATCC 96160 / CBS 514.97 / LARS 414 / MAFF 240422) TaxID=1213857 RepID=A0A484FKD3_COLOR|nr:Fumagillin beta-trans-bergamotene synthase [Colletotrichum orbiculare MAFF 240422]
MGRRTIPLLLSQHVARWSLAALMVCWTVGLIALWRPPAVASVAFALLALRSMYGYVSSHDEKDDYASYCWYGHGILGSVLPPKVVSEADPVTGLYNPFPMHLYTGSVRPVYPLSPMRAVPKSIKHPDWVVTGIPKAERRLGRTKVDLLDARAQDAIREVYKFARGVLDITAAELRLGVTTDYLDDVCHKSCVEREVSAVTFGCSQKT